MDRQHGAARAVGRGWYLDAALSFLVYLIPLVTAHSLSLAGEYLIRSARHRWLQLPWWVVTEVAVVLGAQVALFVVLRLSRRGSRAVRGILLAVALVVLTPAINAALLVVIPVRYLIEESTAPAHNQLTEICLIPDVDLIPTSQSVFSHDAPAALVVRRDERLALVNVPDCRVAPLDMPSMAEVASLSPGGILWTVSRRTAEPPAEWFVTSFAGHTHRIDGSVVPVNAAPRLLDDGDTIGWIEQGTTTRIALVTASGIRHVPIPGVPPGSFGPLRGAGPSGPFHMSVIGAGAMQWFTVDGAGQVLTSVDSPDVMSRFSHELIPLPTGWIAWDTYVERHPYRLAWSRSGHVTQRELAKGLAITSLAVDTPGEFVAVSATSALSIGSQQDEVWLLRTSDGSELFRRYAPKYSRATVALPGGRFFAVSEIAGGRPAVRIHPLPEAP
jgi:hypothetical protein